MFPYTFIQDSKYTLAQLPGSLFNIGPYDHLVKYQGVFMGLLWNTF